MAFMRYYYNITDFSALQMVFVTTATIGLSLMSYYFVEAFFRKKGSVTLWVSISALLVANILLANNITKISSRMDDIPVEYAAPSMGRNSHGGSFRHAEIFGDTTRNDDIILIGDSHAYSLKPYLNRIGRNNSFSFRTITNDSYAPIPGIGREQFTTQRFYDRYARILPHSMELIDNARIIILTVAQTSEATNEDAIVKLIGNLEPGQALLFLSDYPHLDKNPARINRDFIRDPKRRNDYTKTYATPNAKIMGAINSNPNAFYVDLTDTGFFGDAPFHNDTLMYYDQGHLNYYGAVQYAIETESIFMRYLGKANMAAVTGFGQ